MNRSILIRYYFVVAVVMVVVAVFAWRLTALHMVSGRFLQGEGRARALRVESIDAHRGMIEDRNGKPLAISSPVGSIWVNPQQFSVDRERLHELAAALDVGVESVIEKIRGSAGREFVYLKRHLPPMEAERVMLLNLDGVYVDREYHRFYPAGEVTSHLLGFTNIDDQGQEGVELAFEPWLQGEVGCKQVMVDRNGRIFRDVKPLKEAVPGKGLALSVDLRVQYLAYKELKTAMQAFGADSGSLVILDVLTSEVVAIVNQPAFNPNDRATLTADHVRNRAFTDVFEPGSTVKPFTVAAALESGAVGRREVIDTSPGFIRVDTKTFRDPRNRGELTLDAIIAHSSQVGISKIALRLDPEEMFQMLVDLGFGADTGSGFPGERPGYLPSHRRWTDIERVTMAFGYGLMVTPIQLASSYLTIASGGVKKPLTFLKSSEQAGDRVMSRYVTDEVMRMLTRVVTSGTGKRAAIEGYTVAGKTGTVRKVGADGYEDTRHLSFFVGITPVEEPRLVGVVMINDSRKARDGGGEIAAPVFARVMSGALRILNVAPSRFSGAS